MFLEIHVNVWQNLLQCGKVISLQLNKFIFEKNNLRKNEETIYINGWFAHAKENLSKFSGRFSVALLIYLLYFRLKDFRSNTRRL